jgi:hypothetical protein
MAGQATIKVIGPSYFLADRKSAVQRAVNLYMAGIEGVGEDKQVVLSSAPGLTTLVDLGADIRGSYNAGGRWFVVAGSTLYEMTTAGVATARGTLGTSSGDVSMKYGRDQLVIVDGPNGYVFTLATGAFAQITDPDWRGSNAVDELDGYFIFVDPDTDQFYVSAIDNASAMDALDFSSADTSPDNIITHRVRKRELHLFGDLSTEIWINSGDPDFPFARYNSTPIDVGIVGQRAVVSAADSLVWVGKTDRGSGYVYKMEGHQPVRISTQAVEEALNTSTDLTQCSLWTYHIEGAEFVGVNAPGLETTWVYDFSTEQWHERGEYADGWTPWRVDRVTFVSAGHYAAAGAKLYTMSDDVYSIDGAPIVRERTWPHLMAPSFEPITFRSVELACSTGYGGNVTLEVSNDGGFTFGPPLARSLGAVGQWMQRVRWLMLGSARDRVFRMRCSDAVPFVIHAATVDA